MNVKWPNIATNEKVYEKNKSKEMERTDQKEEIEMDGESDNIKRRHTCFHGT